MNNNVEEQNLLKSHGEEIRVQELYMELIMLIPSLIIFFILYTTENSFLTLILYQLILLSIPLIFLKFVTKGNIVNFFTSNFFFNWRKQLVYGIFLNFLAFFLTISVFIWILTNETHYVILYNFLLPANQPIYVSLFFFIALLNPFLSEIYWRIIPHSMQKKPNKLRLAFYYGLFHGLIIYKIKDSLTGMLFIPIYMMFGGILTLIKEKIGALAAVLTHMGVNLTYSLAFILVIREQRRFFS